MQFRSSVNVAIDRSVRRQGCAIATYKAADVYEHSEHEKRRSNGGADASNANANRRANGSADGQADCLADQDSNNKGAD